MWATHDTYIAIMHALRSEWPFIIIMQLSNLLRFGAALIGGGAVGAGAGITASLPRFNCHGSRSWVRAYSYS